MVLALGRTVHLHRDGYSDSQAGRHAEDQTQPEAVTEAKQDRIRHGSSQQPQRAMRASQQVVRKIETTQHIQTTARNGDSSNRVMVHPTIVDVPDNAWSRAFPD